MDPAFYSYFCECMMSFGKTHLTKNDLYWDRLNGKNRFCTKKFNPEVQVNQSNKHGAANELRRTQLNYCFKLHGTIECRLFPMFSDIDTASKAILALLDCYESYLDKAPPLQTIKESISFVTNDRGIIECV